MKDLVNLIEKINTFNQYKKRIKENSEENFNIFRICGVNHYENTHSAILAELIRNDGSHSFNKKFLNALLSLLKEDKIVDEDFNFILSNSSVLTEFSVGNGRIDILIKNDNQCIIIENKIYASDQNEQLKRYESFAKQYFKQYQLLYLTLWGDEASVNSSEGVNYKQISYYETIVKWLEKCVEISARNPIIRETIIQYINHIKILTNTNLDNKMNNELVEILSKKENIDSVFTIGDNFDNVKNYIINKTFLPQLSSVCEKLNLVNESTEYNRVNTSWSGFQITNPNWKYFKIAFEFEAKGLRNPIIGITHINPDIRNEPVFEILKTRFKGKNKNWVWHEFSHYRNWRKEAMFAIQDGKMSEIFKNEIKNILKLTDDITDM